MKWHYVLTVEIPELGIGSTDRVVEVPGATREQIYRAALEDAVRTMADRAGVDRDRLAYGPIVRFWSLDPNDLPA